MKQKALDEELTFLDYISDSKSLLTMRRLKRKRKLVVCFKAESWGGKEGGPGGEILKLRRPFPFLGVTDPAFPLAKRIHIRHAFDRGIKEKRVCERARVKEAKGAWGLIGTKQKEGAYV